MINMPGLRSSEMMKWQTLRNVAAQQRETRLLIAARKAFPCPERKVPGRRI
ncbi:hypothetical protein ACVDG8_033290 [Mesorhizobium sp. ORM8.1]